MTLAGRALSYGGVALPVAALGTHAQGGLPAGATAAVALLGLGMLGLRAHVAGILPSPGRRARRIGAPMLAVVLVASAAVGPVAGATGAPAGQPALGVSSSTTCTALSTAASFATLGVAGPAVQSTCTSWTTAQQVADTANSDANVTKQDITLAAEAQAAEFESTRTVYDNYLNDSRSAAWSKAEIAVSNAYANNSSKTEARAAAREAIKDYWSVKEQNLLSSWNTQVSSMWMLQKRAENESVTPVFRSISALPDYSQSGQGPLRNVSRVNLTLSNGSQMSVMRYKTAGYYWETDYHNGAVFWASPKQITITATPWEHANTEYHWGGIREHQGLNTTSTDTTDSTRVVSTVWYHETLTEIDQTRESQINTSYEWIDGMWSALDNGSVSPSEITSRTTDLYRLSPDASGNASLYRATAALSGLGLSTPDMDGLGTMEVTHAPNNTTDHGLILANQAPNGSWQAHTTYNASEIPGAEYLATTDGQQLKLEGEFRIGNITSTDGAHLKNVTAERTVYRTSNATEYIQKMQRLVNQTQAAQRGGGGQTGSGSGGGGSSPVVVAGLGVLALGFVIYLNNRDN